MAHCTKCRERYGLHDQIRPVFSLRRNTFFIGGQSTMETSLEISMRSRKRQSGRFLNSQWRLNLTIPPQRMKWSQLSRRWNATKLPEWMAHQQRFTSMEAAFYLRGIHTYLRYAERRESFRRIFKIVFLYKNKGEEFPVQVTEEENSVHCRNISCQSHSGQTNSYIC